MRIREIITENNIETINISWDGERYALTHTKNKYVPNRVMRCDVIILNPRELDQIVDFRKKHREAKDTLIGALREVDSELNR